MVTSPLDEHLPELKKIVSIIGRAYRLRSESLEDVTQIFLKNAFEKKVWETYKEGFCSLNWAGTWIRYTIQNYLRDQNRETKVTEKPEYLTEQLLEEDYIASKTAYEPLQSILEEKLPELPIREKTILHFKYEGYTDKETIGVTGMGRFYYEQAAKNLRRRLRPDAEYSRNAHRSRPASRETNEMKEHPIYVPPHLKQLVTELWRQYS